MRAGAGWGAALPTVETVEAWAAQAPVGFTYATKLGQFGSHRMKLRDAASWLPNHLDRVERPGAALGPTLVQFPPRWKRNVERLDEFRFHGPNAVGAAYQGRYGGRRLWRTAARLASWIDEGSDVYAYFNNDDSGFAVEDARWLAQRLRP